MLPISFRVPLLVGRVLARSNLVDGVPFCFHPHVGVTLERVARDVPSDAHDYFVANPDSASSVTSVWPLTFCNPVVGNGKRRLWNGFMVVQMYTLNRQDRGIRNK